MVPGNNHTRSFLLYVAIEAVGWVTVALGILSAGAGLLSAPPEGSLLPVNIGAATPGVTLAVAGLFAAGLAHHGRIAIEMARSLRHLVHLSVTAAEAHPAALAAEPPAPPPPLATTTAASMPQPVVEVAPEPEPEPLPEPEPEPAPTLPPAELILPPLPPLEPEPVRQVPPLVEVAPQFDPGPPPEVPAAASEPGPEETTDASAPDVVVYRNVQVELRADGIFIRDRQFGSVDEARAFIDRVLDRAPR
jgi:hypothetical protein